MADTIKDGALCVWWIPQVPMTQFWVDVRTIEEAAKILAVLAAYDDFQFEHNVKVEYCNAGGLCVYEDGEWVYWYDPDTGASIDDFIAAREAKSDG